MKFFSNKFLGWVIIPTLAAALYFFFLATPVYRSTANVMITNQSKETGGFSAFLSGGTGDSMTGAFIMKAFTDSWAEYKALDKHFNLRKLWSEGDVISSYYRLTHSDVSLFDYYKRHVSTEIDKRSGIITLETYAYTPQQASALAQKVIEDTSMQINALNLQKDIDLARLSQDQLIKAKDTLAADDQAIAAFRKKTGYYKPDLDYSAVVQTQSTIHQNLASAKADFSGVAGETPNNPAVAGMQDRISAYNRENARMTSKRNSINAVARQYDALESKRALDLAMLEKAGTLAQDTILKSASDHYYLGIISPPSSPETPEFPRAILNTLLTLCGLLVIYKFLVA